jgi:heat shock protein HslJ
MFVRDVCRAARIQVVSLALVVFAGAAGSSVAQEGGALPTAPPGTGEITVELARNAAISGVYDTTVTLTDGVFEGAPFDQGGASRPRLIVMRDLVAFGNLDGAPGDEAAMMLAENSGGTGEMVYLSVIGPRGGAPASIGTIAVGDRTKIVTFGISGADVEMEVVEAGPNDPACCPTQVATRVYALEGGDLKLKGSEVKGTLSMALFAGAEWTAVEIDGVPISGVDRRPTATVAGDRIAGFGGCNRYTGQIKETSPGEIAIGPIAGTRMACPEPEMQLEDRFFASLGKTVRYSFLAGRLVLSGMDGDTMRSVMLTRK